MNFCKTLNLMLILLILNSSSSLFGQKIEPKNRITEPDHIIGSEIMGRDYQLYISFPSGYSTRDTINYPVLYVLDGAFSFPIFSASQGAMDFESEIEDIIIVGIGSGLDLPSWLINRNFDYTISLDSIADSGMENTFGFPKGSVKSGGAAKFLECIKTEIVPFVDKHYKTTSDRGITGHSYGGLFTAYCFINSSGYFTRFGINSPSLWRNNEEILNQAILQFTENTTWNISPTKVFVSVGGSEGPDMVPPMVKFCSYLESSNYKNVDLNWKIFENESHLSVIPAMLSRTISELYGRN